MIKQQTVQEIIETAKIDEVVEEFVSLKKRGANRIGLCPFHNEKTPSFTVSPSKNIFKCFGCGRGGNPIQFVMEHENYSFPEALRFIAKKYNIEIQETQLNQEALAERKKVESLHIILGYANDFFKNQLWNTNQGKMAGLSYFKERGYREQTIRGFELGYAPNLRDQLTTSAITHGYQIDLLRELGLTTKSDTDFFKHRVIFPIHNLSGKVIAFAGRSITQKDRGPKYINSPESEVYHKRKVLYGLFQAKKPIRKEDECLLVEGYTDVISLFQSGIENVVASSGTSLTKDQIKAIKRYTNNITMLYDGDEAGVNAALRGLDLILEEDLNAKILVLPDGHDPDSFIKETGFQQFKDFLNSNAKDVILFKADQIKEQTDTNPIERTLMIRDMVQSIARIMDPIKRSMYIQEISHTVQLEEQLLVKETNKAIRELIKTNRLLKDRQIRQEARIEREAIDVESKKTTDHTQDLKPQIHPSEHQERDIVRLLIQDGAKKFEDGTHVANYIFENISEVLDQFDNIMYNEVVQMCYKALMDNKVLNHIDFVNHEEKSVRDLSVEILVNEWEYSSWDDHDFPLQTQPHPEENFLRDSYSSIMRFKLKKVMKRLKENQDLISQYDDHEDEVRKNLHLKIQQKLLQLRNEIASDSKTVILPFA